MDNFSHDFFLILPQVELALFGLAILMFDFMLGVRDKTGNAVFAMVGMMFMASGYDLIVQFLGLETMAISFYILTGFLRHQRRSNEAAVKYLLLGAFSSGLLAYGFSLLYGISAMADVRGPMGMPLMLPRTNIDVIRAALEQRGPADLLVVLAIATVAAGLFFKVAAVPFHQWAPDVYEGAPTTVTAYISVASKPASFALLLRLLIYGFWPVRVDWIDIIAVVAVASLTIGNLAALTQTNVKRMLAYSSISHPGYV